MSVDCVSLLDSHLHFWDRTHLDYPWMQGLDLPEISSPADDLHYDEHGGVRADVVMIEADIAPAHRPMEVEWATQLARHYPFLKAMVAGVDYTAVGYDALLEHWVGTPLVHGVRDNFEALEAGHLDTQANRHGVLKALASGLTVDLCIRAAQLPELVGFVRAIAEARGSADGMVLDHFGKPDIQGDAVAFRAWQHEMERLAFIPGLAVKISGLAGQAQGGLSADKLTELARRYVIPVVEAFGEERSMFGSDHPVSTLAHGVRRDDWLHSVKTIVLKGHGLAAEPVLSQNARAFYKIGGEGC